MCTDFLTQHFQQQHHARLPTLGEQNSFIAFERAFGYSHSVTRLAFSLTGLQLAFQGFDLAPDGFEFGFFAWAMRVFSSTPAGVSR